MSHPRVCTVFAQVKNFVRDEAAATMVEYGLMLAFIAIVCVGAVSAAGQSLVPLFSEASDTLAP